MYSGITGYIGSHYTEERSEVGGGGAGSKNLATQTPVPRNSLTDITCAM